MHTSSRLSLIALAFLVTSFPWSVARAADLSSPAFPAAPSLSSQPVEPLADATGPVPYETDRKIFGGRGRKGMQQLRGPQATPGRRRATETILASSSFRSASGPQPAQFGKPPLTDPPHREAPSELSAVVANQSPGSFPRDGVDRLGDPPMRTTTLRVQASKRPTAAFAARPSRGNSIPRFCPSVRDACGRRPPRVASAAKTGSRFSLDTHGGSAASAAGWGSRSVQASFCSLPSWVA